MNIDEFNEDKLQYSMRYKRYKRIIRKASRDVGFPLFVRDMMKGWVCVCECGIL